MFENNPLTIPVAYILVLLLCMASLGVFFVKRWLARDLYGKPKVVFYLLFGLMLLVDFAWSTLEYLGYRWRTVAFFANMFWYSAYLVICVRWLEVCLRNVGVDRLRRFVPHFLRTLPAGLTILFVGTSWWTGWAIDTTSAGCYLRGPYLWIVYVTIFTYYMASFLVCIFAGLQTQDITRRRFSYSLATATFPMIFTTYLQYTTGFAFFFIGVIITIAIYDFDVQRKAMEMLAAADKARHDAFTMVSHDIRTPLTAIVGLAELLQGEASESERQRMARAIVTSSRTLMQLVNDVLDLGRLEAGKLDILPQPTDLWGLVDSVFQVFADAANQKGIVLVNAVSNSDASYVVDPQRIRQVLFNLVGNALKFTDKGEIRVASDYADGCLRLAVSDTGCGIAREDLDKLANPYVQVGRHKGRVGSGLGLLICKRLTMLMKGSFAIASELGWGSTFTVTIPCQSAASVASAPTPAPAPKSAAHAMRRILMVDDAPLNLKVMSAMLRKLGQEDITLAHDGQEAFSLLMAEPGRFDLVLTDLQMPKMDGDELLRKIKADARLTHLPVHVITADVQAQTDCADLGFASVIIKPVTIAKLAQVL